MWRSASRDDGGEERDGPRHSSGGGGAFLFLGFVVPGSGIVRRPRKASPRLSGARLTGLSTPPSARSDRSNIRSVATLK